MGLAGGSIAYRAMHAIDDYAIEVLLSLALVTSVYAIALRLHCSAPLAVVAAGLLIGDRGRRGRRSVSSPGGRCLCRPRPAAELRLCHPPDGHGREEPPLRKNILFLFI
ncbi:cation:proton antiporter [Bradyrhizobium sp. SZCCHNR2011]|uniref:cation:proton antiporter domain-containing protein n=1 Tax=Bradyrhizobium sp. SZCCHNR2011 TaxID=3057376 RepID=UPI0039656B64